MPRYFDADNLISKCRDIISERWNDNTVPVSWAEAYADFIYDGIETTSTVDVQEVKHGYWFDKGVLQYYPKPDVNVYHLLWCSECGALHRARPYCEGGWINANYCPNCGAKMDEKDL